MLTDTARRRRSLVPTFRGDPLSPRTALARRETTVYGGPRAPPHLNEKDRIKWEQEQHDALGISAVNFRTKEPDFSFALAVLIVAPVFGAVVIISVLCFSGSDFISSSSAGFLLHLASSNETSAESLWLGISGFCVQLESANKTCVSSPFNTVYTGAYNATRVGDLRQLLPANYASESSQLLAALIFFITATVFFAWAAFDIRTAEILERRRRRKWVAEWLAARRLECLACGFSVAGVFTGVAATLSLHASTSSVSATVNIVGPSISNTNLKICTRGTVITVLIVAHAAVGISILIQLLVIAFDGLARRLRLEYESCIYDLDAFSRDDFVCLQRRLNKMHEMAMQMDTSPIREQVRAALIEYITIEDVAGCLRRQEQLMVAQRLEFERKYLLICSEPDRKPFWSRIGCQK